MFFIKKFQYFPDNSTKIDSSRINKYRKWNNSWITNRPCNSIGPSVWAGAQSLEPDAVRAEETRRYVAPAQKDDDSLMSII